MKRYLTTLVAVAILGCAGHAFAQKPAANVLTGDQLKALLSKGVTVKVTGAARANTAARTSTAVYQRDGTARLNEGSNTNTVIGSWKIDGNKFCTSYTALGSGCFNLQKTGDKTYKLLPLDGLLEGTWEVVK
jgi:tartrate dehydratase alpha subunit/fumarate hydratase class I-like protein